MSAPTASAKVGVLDSGLGGLSVLREIHRLLPNVPTLYVADQAHLPYGPRPAVEIDAFVDAITGYLLDNGARVIVLACHAASAASLQGLRRRYPDVPFVGIEPAVKPAVEATRSRVVGVLTTQATADGALYRRVLARYAHDVRVITRIAPELVALVESGEQESDDGRAAIRACVEPLRHAGADQLVLACTHFPFLAAQIGDIVGSEVRLVDPAPAVARQTARLWRREWGGAEPAHTYATTGAPPAFAAMLHRLLGIEAAVDGLIWRDGRLRNEAVI